MPLPGLEPGGQATPGTPGDSEGPRSQAQPRGGEKPRRRSRSRVPRQSRLSVRGRGLSSREERGPGPSGAGLGRPPRSGQPPSVCGDADRGSPPREAPLPPGAALEGVRRLRKPTGPEPLVSPIHGAGKSLQNNCLIDLLLTYLLLLLSDRRRYSVAKVTLIMLVLKNFKTC